MERMQIAPIKPTIPFEVLEQIDVRVGTINLVEDVEASDKLVKLTVDFGDHKRSILVGMKQERENPKEVEGTKALFVVNLMPKTMMARYPKVCCSISATPTALRLCWPCPRNPCRTAQG